MQKVEEVARAIDPAIFRWRDDMYAYCIRQGDSEEEARDIIDRTYPLHKTFDRARAAIEAMRGPTPEMIDAARETGVTSGEQSSRIYEAMIDAALKEEE